LAVSDFFEQGPLVIGCAVLLCQYQYQGRGPKFILPLVAEGWGTAAIAMTKYCAGAALHYCTLLL
jgi:hypothetical protein